jgi:hypothetical protein
VFSVPSNRNCGNWTMVLPIKFSVNNHRINWRLVIEVVFLLIKKSILFNEFKTLEWEIMGRLGIGINCISSTKGQMKCLSRTRQRPVHTLNPIRTHLHARCGHDIHLNTTPSLALSSLLTSTIFLPQFLHWFVKWSPFTSLLLNYNTLYFLNHTTSFIL